MPYVDGIVNGVGREYYETSGLKMEMTYVDAVANGTAKFYDQDGKLSAEANYKDGKKTGRRRIMIKTAVLLPRAIM